MDIRGLKCFVVFITLIFAGFGVVLVTIGVWILLDKHELVQISRIFTDSGTPGVTKMGLLEAAAVIAIAGGLAKFISSIMMCCGVGKSSKCLLALTMGIIVCLLLIDIAIIVLTALTNEKIQNNLKDELTESVINEYEGYLKSTNTFTRAFDKAQVQFECCGVVTYTEFRNTSLKWYDKESLQIPKACCKMNKDLYLNNDQYQMADLNCARILRGNTTNIEKACYNDIYNWLEDKTALLLGLAAGACAVLFVAIILTVCLICNIGDKIDYEYEE